MAREWWPGAYYTPGTNKIAVVTHNSQQLGHLSAVVEQVVGAVFSTSRVTWESWGYFEGSVGRVGVSFLRTNQRKGGGLDSGGWHGGNQGRLAGGLGHQACHRGSK